LPASLRVGTMTETEGSFDIVNHLDQTRIHPRLAFDKQ
jgi:hypothetical protein